MYTYNGRGYSKTNIIFTERQHLVYKVIYAPEATASISSRTPLIIIFHMYTVIPLQLIKHMLHISLLDLRQGFRDLGFNDLGFHDLGFRDLVLLRGLVAALPSPLNHCPSHASQLARTKSLIGRMTMNKRMGKGRGSGV